MVNNHSAQLDQVFGALSDPTRRAILERLSLGQTTVSELAAPFSSSLPAISKHLRVLEGAGLIARRTVGRQRVCSIAPAAMESAAEWIEHYRRYWNERLDSLERYLETDTENK